MRKSAKKFHDTLVPFAERQNIDMKKFRITWLVFVILTVMLFTGYRLYEHFKMDSSGPVEYAFEVVWYHLS